MAAMAAMVSLNSAGSVRCLLILLFVLLLSICNVFLFNVLVFLRLILRIPSPHSFKARKKRGETQSFKGRALVTQKHEV